MRVFYCIDGRNGPASRQASLTMRWRVDDYFFTLKVSLDVRARVLLQVEREQVVRVIPRSAVNFIVIAKRVFVLGLFLNI